MPDSIESAFATDDECWMHDGYGHIQRYRVRGVSASGRVAVRTGYRSTKPVYTDDPVFKTFADAKAHLIRIREQEVERRRGDLERAQQMLGAASLLQEPTEPDAMGLFRVTAERTR